MRIKAGYANGYPFRCCICYEMKEAGRVYDIDRVGIPDPMSDGFKAEGTVTICESCRKEFTSADLELDADNMYEWSMNEERHRQEQTEPDQGAIFNEPHKHWTFPVRG
jgi:hypothetical protein